MVRVRLISPDRTRVHIVVADEQRTGKFTLIRIAFIEDFCENVAPILPPAKLPVNKFLDGVLVTLIDTSSAGYKVNTF